MANALYEGTDEGHLYVLTLGSFDVTNDIGDVVDTVSSDSLGLGALAWDATTSTLFGITRHVDPDHPDVLISINPATGAATIIGAIGLGKAMSDMTVSPSGVIYAVSGGANARICTINKSTGAGTWLAAAGPAWGGGIQFVGSTLYYIPQTPNSDQISTVDPTTGARTNVGTTTGASVGVNSSTYHNGVLYVSEYSSIYELNTSTLVLTYQDSGIEYKSEALASVPIPPAPAPPPPPVNDDFANATEIFGGLGSITGTTVGATPDWPTGFSDTSRNVWYKITPTVSGDYTFSSPETGNVRVFTGTFPGLTDLTGSFPVTISMTAGTEYYIMVAYVSDPSFTLYWRGPYTTPFRTEWKIGLYNPLGTPKESTSYDGSETNEFLKHATDCTLTYPLNGIDQLEFSLLLDDPAALLITKKNTFVRVWRFINDTENSKTRSPDWDTPDFCGVVTGITKSGEENKVKVTVMGVLWLIQVHFHLLNHRLVNDPLAADVPSYREGSNETGLQWDHSALMFHLIDLINGAWKLSGGDTGIRRPPTATFSGTGYMTGETLYWPQTIATPPLYVMSGQYTWPILTELLGRDAAPDIVPQYIWKEGYLDRMYFKTAVIRGTDKTATVSFDYHTGQKNLSNCEEQSQVVPGAYGNVLWVSGDGGPNGGTLVTSTDSASIADNGVYMVSENIPGKKLADIQQYADSKKKVAVDADAEIYSASISPASPLYYDLDYMLGDLVNFNADKGALQAANKHQRVYQVTLHWSDNNVESTEVMISNDFKRKFP